MVRDAKGRFKKGESGNPLGSARRVREAEYIGALAKRVSLKQWVQIIDKAVKLAIEEGDWRARQWLSDYLLGKPVQRHEHGGTEGVAIEHHVKVIGNVVEADMWPDGVIGGSNEESV